MVDELVFDRVIGWAFLRRVNDIFTVPIVWEWNRNPETTFRTLDPSETPVAIVPESYRTFRVSGVYDKGEPTEQTIVLGYMFDSANHPDWKQELIDRKPV